MSERRFATIWPKSARSMLRADTGRRIRRFDLPGRTGFRSGRASRAVFSTKPTDTARPRHFPSLAGVRPPCSAGNRPISNPLPPSGRPPSGGQRIPPYRVHRVHSDDPSNCATAFLMSLSSPCTHSCRLGNMSWTCLSVSRNSGVSSLNSILYSRPGSEV